MSLISLYEKKKTAFGPPVVKTTYEQFVFNMERSGLNNLVTLNEEDPLFTPPKVTDTYIGKLFREGVLPG